MLADKESLQFVMKDGMVVTSHAGNGLPKELFAKQVFQAPTWDQKLKQKAIFRAN